ncbi:MAG TPA: hypothetical protein VJO34_16375 [Methylomirabilota bacterium]|nr:hypothetical protein [Methylomirabilota bacterium]
MSLILSGPRRIYIMLLFWERLADPCLGCPHALSRIQRAMGAEEPPNGAARCESSRLVLTVRLQRILWRRLVGLSLLVLDHQMGGKW